MSNQLKEATALVDAMIEQLRETHDTVDIYGAHAGWLVQLKNKDRTKSVTDPSLVSAISKAVEVKFLPVVPPRPRRTRWSVEKNGRDWRVLSDGMFVTRSKTKRESEEIKERCAKAEHERCINWSAEWGAVVANGVEGVDWEWARR